MNQPLRASILDRLCLIDESKIDEHSLQSLANYDEISLRQSVSRNLERILNTRRKSGLVPRELGESTRSHLRFGILDFTEASMGGSEAQSLFRRDVIQAVELFEPRLQSIQVRFPSVENRIMSFEITAQLKIPPKRIERVVYQSSRNVVTDTFEVVPA